MAKPNMLPIVALGAGVLFMMKKKGGGAGGRTYQGANNIYLVDTGDTAEGVEAEAGFPVIYVASSFQGMTSDAIAAYLLPVAQANPDIAFVVVGVGAPANQMAMWGGYPAAVPNRIVIMAAITEGADGLKIAILEPSPPVTLDIMDAEIALALAHVQTMASVSGTSGVTQFVLNTRATGPGGAGGGSTINCPSGQAPLTFESPPGSGQMITECMPLPLVAAEKNQGVAGTALGVAFARSGRRRSQGEPVATGPGVS